MKPTRTSNSKSEHCCMYTRTDGRHEKPTHAQKQHQIMKASIAKTEDTHRLGEQQHNRDGSEHDEDDEKRKHVLVFQPFLVFRRRPGRGVPKQTGGSQRDKALAPGNHRRARSNNTSRTLARVCIGCTSEKRKTPTAQNLHSA